MASSHRNSKSDNGSHHSNNFDFGFSNTANNSNQHVVGQQPQQQPAGVYASYKKATAAFRDGLARLLPKGFPLASVQDFKRGADAVVQQNLNRMHAGSSNHHHSDNQENQGHCNKNHDRRKDSKKITKNNVLMVEQAVMDSLNTSIQYRQEQARKHGNHSDRGHDYIINVLRYCREALVFNNQCAHYFISKQVNKGNKGKSEQAHHARGSRCRALGEEEDSKQTTDIWNMNMNVGDDDKSPECQSKTVPVEPLPPPAVASRDSTSDDDLVDTDDRFQCIAFLSTMDRLMGVIRDKFDEVKRVCIEECDNDQLLLRSLMQAAVSTNICVDCVQSTWAELTLDHSHIRSFYDLLAILFVLPQLSAEKHDNVMSFKNDRCPHLLTHLVGDLVEACFAVDGLETSKAFKTYSSNAGLPDGDWEKEALLEDARLLAWDVSDIVMERGSSKIRRSFLSEYKFIGGRRCILNTFKVMQSMFAHLHPTRSGDTTGESVKNTLVKAAINTFGSIWHEDKNPARQLPHDLDRLLAGEVLPDLIAVCYDQPEYLVNNPGVSKFLPILQLLNKHVSQQISNPIEIHLAFAIHALLISIVSLQGNGHVERIAMKSSPAFEDYFETLQQSSTVFCRGEELHGIIFKYLQYVGQPTCPSDSISSGMRAYWNPLMAGSFCAYAAHMGLACGTSYIQHNVRSVLHLYNALRCNRLVDEIDFLELLDRIFWTTPAIWVAGKTTCKGSFTKTRLLGMGFSVRDVSIVLTSLKAEHGIQTNRYRYADDRKNSCSFTRSTIQYLRAHDFSNGCAAFLGSDYSRLLDNGGYGLKDYQRLTECEVFVERACKAIRQDSDRFGGSFLNIIEVGRLLREFLTLLNSAMNDCDLGACIGVLGELDFTLDSSRLERAPLASKMMEEHFGPVQRSQYTFNSGL